MLLAPLAAYGQADKGLEQRMRDIIIPSIEFREANPIDVLQFLLEASTATYPKTPSLGLLSTNTPATREYYTFEAEDGTPLELHPLTLEYRRLSMLEAVDRITKEIGLTYRLENETLIFFTQDGKRIIRKMSVEQGVPPYSAQGALSGER